MNRWIETVIAAALIVSVFTGCAQTLPTAAPETSSPTAEPTPAEDEIELVLRQMTLEEKIGQLFIIRPDALDFTQTPEQIKDPYAEGVTELTSAMADVLSKYPVGGIALFGKNISTAQQMTGFIGELQSASGIPLFMAVDEEGGRVARIANSSAFDVTKYESAAAVGASGDTAAAMDMGATIGAYLRQYGFNLDFAPVADVYSNPDNTVIGDRAFSSDAGTAAKMAKAMAEGLKQQQIIPTFKHFPGHGDTAEDSP